MIKSQQTVIIRADSELLRRIRSFLQEEKGYASLSEFAAVALANQLELESPGSMPDAGTLPPLGLGASTNLLGSPTSKPVELARERDLEYEPLFVLTNRLFPIKVACRVLANLTLEGDAPLARFRDCAARTARSLGARLREEDERAERRGAERRWVALPVGADEHAALSRFATFFTLDLSASKEPTGPLPLLGLAYTVAETSSCLLTRLGWDLAVASNPVLDGIETGPLLSQTERDLFGKALGTNPAEAEAIQEFREAVLSASGIQAEVDVELQQRHPSWNPERATAHRAAMVGRLRDLGRAEVDGRGPSARIELNVPASYPWRDGEKSR